MARSQSTWATAAYLAALVFTASTAQAQSDTVLCPVQPDGDEALLLQRGEALHVEGRDDEVLALFEAGLRHPLCHFTLDDPAEVSDALRLLDDLRMPGAEPGWHLAGRLLVGLGAGVAFGGLIAEMVRLYAGDELHDRTPYDITYVVAGSLLVVGIVLMVVGFIRNAGLGMDVFGERRDVLVGQIGSQAR